MAGKAVKVGLALQDDMPVVDVEQRAERMAAGLAELGEIEEDRQQYYGDQHENDCRHEATEAAQPEGRQAKALAAQVAAHKVGSNEVARERKEHTDAQVAAGQPGRV